MLLFKNMKTNKNIIIFYHGNCLDGYGAAWIAWKKFGNKAEYIPLTWNIAERDKTAGYPYKFSDKEIYFLDLTPRGLIIYLKNLRNKIICIDHHISQKGNLKLADNYLFGIEHSGAYFAWKYFYPKKKTPRLIKHISDQDTWQWKIKWTNEITQRLWILSFNFNLWDKFAKRIESKKGFLEATSEGALLIKNDDINNGLIISEGIREVLFEGRKVYAVNSPISESKIGHELAKDKGVGIVWSMRRNGSIKVSLRSVGNIDVSKMAGKYGGGGHKGAAGFVIPEGKPLPWKYIKKSKAES